MPAFTRLSKPVMAQRLFQRPHGPVYFGTPAELCAACNLPFKDGDYTVLIPLGPGADSEARERARAGRPYNAIAVEIHYSCATGEEVEVEMEYPKS